MNRIYLDKLFEFTYGTYKNYYGQFNKVINLNDEITKIKQNLSLNEKGFFMKYSFVDLSNLIPSIECDECVLINPISFNIEDNQEWYNFLNCLLLILNEEYIKESNITKKKFLQTADKMYKKHLIINKNLTKENYEKISELTGLNIVILNNEENKFNIFEYSKTQVNKWLVCYKFGNDYFPIWNFEKKYFTSESEFIKYLKNFIINNKTKIISDEKPDEKPDEKLDEKLKVEFVEDTIVVKGQKNKDGYEELVTNEDYALYISEAVDNKNVKKQKIKKLSDTPGEKKKSKTNKNIFVTLEQEEIKESKEQKKENYNDEEIDNSVFKKTEVIDKAKIKEILSNIKSSTKLEQIQAFALELNISIVSGATKDGKPKNKTKNELIDEIKKLDNNM
jgi:hypothetical protein